MSRYLAKLKIRKAMRANKSSKPKARKDRRPASPDRRLLSIGLTTALALVLTVTFPFLTTRTMLGASTLWGNILLLILFFAIIPLAVIYNIFYSIVIPFDRTIPWQARVLLVIVGYLAMILTYSGVYFSIAAIGDYNQAVSSNIHFEFLWATSLSEWSNKSREDLIRALKDQRAFKGMGHSLFLAIHEDPVNTVLGERKYLTPQEILRRAQNKNEHEPRLDSGAVWGLFGDCLHYSIVSSAKGGAGDIAPTTLFAKLVTDTQILISWGIPHSIEFRGKAWVLSHYS
jgi:hypothetical protein